MKINKSILILPVLFASLNCSEQNEKNIAVEKNEQNSVSFANKAMSNYQGQLQYINGQYDTMEFAYANNFKTVVPSNEYDWAYFDRLYNENLNIGEKQYIAYLVLAKKDLLNDFKHNPTQEKFNVILKYTNLLVDTKYIGYCLLYNCLQTLKNSSYLPETNNLESLRQSIIQYSKGDTFLQDAKANLSTTDPKSSNYLQKIIENYEYLSNIDLIESL